MKKGLLILLISLCWSGFVVAQDSLFFYKSGDIIYSNSTYNIDSVTFVAPDYYAKYRSNVVFNYLNQETDLTKFAQMIQIARLEKELDNMTIWAPVNSALSQIDLTDTALVKLIVKNHIAANLIYIWPGSTSRLVSMLNNKHYPIQTTNGTLTLDGKTILASNNKVSGSIIHTLSEYVPAKLNLWEYITQGTGHDLLKAYVNSKNILDGEKIIGNDILAQMTFLNDENIVSTFIIPSDEAWTDAYSKLYPYCASFNGTTANAQEETTKLAIIHNNAYMGKLNPNRNDTSYLSTSGYELKSPATMLTVTDSNSLSNGTAINVSQLKMYNSEFWNKEIRMEAENVGFGRTILNYTATRISDEGTGYDLSKDYYISLAPTTSSGISKLNVKFPIPNTLSTKYNVYCVFVPTAIADTTDKRPYKVKFYFSYQGQDGTQVTDKGVTATNTLAATTSQIGIFTTNPTTVTKMLVLKDFQLPYCNFVLSNQSPINVALKVENAANPTGSDMINYNRNIRIDCIILEPVQ